MCVAKNISTIYSCYIPMIYRRARYGIDIKNKFNNNDFKPTEFEGFKNRAGENAFTLSPKKLIKGKSQAFERR